MEIVEHCKQQWLSRKANLFTTCNKQQSEIRRGRGRARLTGYFLRVGEIAISVIICGKDFTDEKMKDKDRIACYTFLNGTASQNVPQSPQATTTSGVFLRIGIPPSQVK